MNTYRMIDLAHTYRSDDQVAADARRRRQSAEATDESPRDPKPAPSTHHSLANIALLRRLIVRSA
jgi:hypothetical protein